MPESISWLIQHARLISYIFISFRWLYSNCLVGTYCSLQPSCATHLHVQQTVDQSQYIVCWLRETSSLACLHVCCLYSLRWQMFMTFMLCLNALNSITNPQNETYSCFSAVIVSLKPKSHAGLLPGLAPPSWATFKLHYHDCDVVGTATVERLQNDAFGAEVRLVQTLADEADGLLVAKCIPQAVGCQDHELWLQFVQVKGHDVWVRDHNVEVLQWVITQRTGHGQYSLDSPGSVKTDKAPWIQRYKW